MCAVFRKCRYCHVFRPVFGFHSKSQGLCSPYCEQQYDAIARILGGYHVLARDERIEELLEENQRLRAELMARAS